MLQVRWAPSEGSHDVLQVRWAPSEGSHGVLQVRWAPSEGSHGVLQVRWAPSARGSAVRGPRNPTARRTDTRSMMRRRVGEAPWAVREKVERARALRRAMTPAERCLWRGLRRTALGVRARPQHVIRGWIVDFYIAAWRLVIEVDGDVHDLQVDEDARRT